jgi:hypothetical protein
MQNNLRKYIGYVVVLCHVDDNIVPTYNYTDYTKEDTEKDGIYV